MTRPQHNSLLTADHLRRKACVYVRQSSEVQVRTLVERQKLQYALASRARELGFEAVEVVDDDQGSSGGGVHFRRAHRRLVRAGDELAAAGRATAAACERDGDRLRGPRRRLKADRERARQALEALRRCHDPVREAPTFRRYGQGAR